MPDENYLYFGDTKNMPYGEKTEEQLIEFSDKIFKFFRAYESIREYISDNDELEQKNQQCSSCCQVNNEADYNTN